ncbi:hypothetical protein BDA96_04G186300 [Sorghum bicolor]|uniref:Uncharacterized protein n=1 Tax=Sorghum bicolor TaxID=4558 RepID=A0A921R6Z3_SORBI|nr:hypothetical protein BDA96_04G186300 [Sorghum bicolor]
MLVDQARRRRVQQQEQLHCRCCRQGAPMSLSIFGPVRRRRCHLPPASPSAPSAASSELGLTNRVDLPN